MNYYVDERTGKVHIMPDLHQRTHEECVKRIKSKAVRKAQKAARKRNRRK